MLQKRYIQILGMQLVEIVISTNDMPKIWVNQFNNNNNNTLLPCIFTHFLMWIAPTMKK